MDESDCLAKWRKDSTWVGYQEEEEDEESSSSSLSKLEETMLISIALSEFSKIITTSKVS